MLGLICMIKLSARENQGQSCPSGLSKNMKSDGGDLCTGRRYHAGPAIPSARAAFCQAGLCSRYDSPTPYIVPRNPLMGHAECRKCCKSFIMFQFQQGSGPKSSESFADQKESHFVALEKSPKAIQIQTKVSTGELFC